MQIPSFFLLGLDSFVCGLVIGSFTKRWRRKLLLTIFFGLSDGAATVMGQRFGLHSPFPAIAVLAAYIALVWLTSLAFSKAHDKVLFLPFVLCIDNVVWSDLRNAAISVAVSSALMAWCGLTLAFLASKALNICPDKTRGCLPEWWTVINRAPTFTDNPEDSG